MKIAVVGLGLIGGSLCKAIKKHTRHTCLGFDIDKGVIRRALDSGAIDAAIEERELSRADLTAVCLHPRQTIDFIVKNAENFRRGSTVVDVCGVKEAIVDSVTGVLAQTEVTFIGTHPMAGREFSGFDYASDTLFDGASFIITPLPDTPAEKTECVKDLARSLKFNRIVVTTPREHDQIIAYTSQLAHVVSSAYIKSPSLQKHTGFSAGSFLDMTRVARLNEDMWSDLFMLNRRALQSEIKTIIAHLCEYNEALASGNEAELKKLLRQGRLLKEESAKKDGSGA